MLESSIRSINIISSNLCEGGLMLPKEEKGNYPETTNSKSYRYALAPTSQFYFCGIPFRFDTAPKCPLNCSYCFAMSRGGRRTSSILLVNPSRIQRKIDRLFDSPGIKRDINDEMLLSRMPIHFGGMSDPFASPDISNRSLQILDTFNQIDYPIVISTKNTRFLTLDKNLDRISRNKNLVIQISFSIVHERYAKEIEPCVPSPIERIKAINYLAKQGHNIFVRIQPLFPNYIEEIKNQLIPSLGEAGVKHITLEFLKLPVEKNLGRSKDLFISLDWDGMRFYNEMHAEIIGREWLLPTKLKWDLLQPLIEQIHKYGMTYGAGDYGLNHLGDTDCCCGVDIIEGFSNWSKNNFSNWIRNNRTNVIMLSESVRYSLPSQSIKMYINSHSRIDEGNSIFDYLKSKWNRPGTVNAPDSYLGIEWKGDFDGKGNCVYIRSN